MKYVLELKDYRTPRSFDSKTKQSINRSNRNPGRDVKFATAITAVSEAVALAFVLACAAPFGTVTRKPGYAPDDDLGGRDPNW